MVPRTSLRTCSKDCSELARIDSAGDSPRLLGTSQATAYSLTVPVYLARSARLSHSEQAGGPGKRWQEYIEEKVARN